jgi:hypothetical protein
MMEQYVVLEFEIPPDVDGGRLAQSGGQSP